MYSVLGIYSQYTCFHYTLIVSLNCLMAPNSDLPLTYISLLPLFDIESVINFLNDRDIPMASTFLKVPSAEMSPAEI